MQLVQRRRGRLPETERPVASDVPAMLSANYYYEIAYSFMSLGATVMYQCNQIDNL